MMSRVFAGLAIGNVLVLVGAGAFGWFKPDPVPDRHILLGVFGLLISLFVQVLTFTYFTVTGKIVLQAVHLAGHDPQAVAAVARLKRSMTHHLMVLVLGIVVMTVSGAVQWRTGNTASLHLLSGLAFLPLVCAVLVGEYGLIVQNRVVLDEATQAYESWRRSRTTAPVSGDP